MTLSAAAPTCTPWCEAHTRADAGWSDDAKVCRADTKAAVDADGDPLLVELERHAFLEDGRAVTDCPAITVRCTGRIAPDAARALAGALVAAADAIDVGTA